MAAVLDARADGVAVPVDAVETTSKNNKRAQLTDRRYLHAAASAQLERPTPRTRSPFPDGSYYVKSARRL
jgi:hypothetical protein